MKDMVSKEVFAQFPDYIRGVVVARGIDNRSENPQLLDLLRNAESHAAQNESLKDIKNHPMVANWRRAYSDFGANPNKFHCSIESLSRRARRGDNLPYINTLVAIFNYFSLCHIVPSGGDDLDKVDKKLCLTLAKGNEPFTPLNSNEIEYPALGEVIYVDESKVMCRRWNWRQGEHTKITTATTKVAINVDCLPPVLEDEARTITEKLADLINEFCCGEVTYFLLNASKNAFEI